MMTSLYGDLIERIWLYDLRGIDPATVSPQLREKTIIADDWYTLYRSCSVIATCTVSDSRYIDEAPQGSALLLNVSLRDYLPQAVAGIRAVVVDDWAEVCRENTDIELLHLQHSLTEAGTVTLTDVICRGALNRYAADEPVFFNPMGLAVFDIAIAGHYLREAGKRHVGEPLEMGAVQV
jgi:ornithine cyclodeaminase